MTSAPAERGERETRLVALVLALAYLLLAVLYAWQASRRLSPTIFVDEIELTQISRSIAESGSPSRRGEPYGSQTLYAYLLAPAWWLDDVKTSWEAVKLIGVLVMTATIFPAYALARLVLSRPWAAAAAVAAVAAPPLAYAPYLMQEPVAYPVSTLGLWLVARYVARPTWRTFGVALAAAGVASLVRAELTVLLGVLGAGAAYHGWRDERFARWRRTWTAGDWAGFATLLVGGAVVASAAAGHRSERWYVATGFLKGKLLENALWAVGALAIGLAVLPVVAGLAALVAPATRRVAGGAAFTVTGVAAVVAFVGYSSLKGAYVSTALGPLVVERNAIYLVPVLLTATCLALTRVRLPLAAVVGAATLVLWCLAEVRLELDKYPYFEAPSLAIGALANRNWAMDEGDVRLALYLVLAIAIGLLLVRRALASPRAANALAAGAVAAVAAWALTTEIYAARGLNVFAERLYEATPKPLDWVQQATGGEEAIYLGQQERDPNAVWLLEFWNPVVKRVWSVDGSAPAPTLTPDLSAADGTLHPDPGVRWVVARDGVAVAGEVAAEPRGGMTLFRLDGPLQLRHAQAGVEPDGWMGAAASYSLYEAGDTSTRGFARVVLSRQGACGDAFPTSTVVVEVGPLTVGPNNQPTLARVTERQRLRLRPCELRTVVLRARVPYHVRVTLDPTFVPREVDASSGDTRSLGAQVAFDFLPIGSGG